MKRAVSVFPTVVPSATQYHYCHKLYSFCLTTILTTSEKSEKGLEGERAERGAQSRFERR